MFSNLHRSSCISWVWLFSDDAVPFRGHNNKHNKSTLAFALALIAVCTIKMVICWYCCCSLALLFRRKLSWDRNQVFRIELILVQSSNVVSIYVRSDYVQLRIRLKNLLRTYHYWILIKRNEPIQYKHYGITLEHSSWANSERKFRFHRLVNITTILFNVG